jgi:AcrR family transcriptional regulator
MADGVKRADILAAAHELFAARGFQDTTMRTLAAEARVSTATIYAHFADKGALLAALLEARVDALINEILRAAATEDDPVDGFVAGLRALGRGLADDRFLGELLAHRTHVTDRRMLERARAVEDKLDAVCTGAIQGLVRRRRLVCRDPEALTALVRVSLQGWLLTEARRRKPVSEERLMATLVALIRGNVRPRARVAP